MTLMERIKVKPFQTMSLSEQYDIVEMVRKKRSAALERARISTRKGLTKSAIKNIAKRKNSGKKMLKDPKAAAMKALEKLSPEQIAALTKMFKN